MAKTYVKLHQDSAPALTDTDTHTRIVGNGRYWRRSQSSLPQNFDSFSIRFYTTFSFLHPLCLLTPKHHFPHLFPKKTPTIPYYQKPFPPPPFSKKPSHNPFFLKKTLQPPLLRKTLTPPVFQKKTLPPPLLKTLPPSPFSKKKHRPP